eukprot:PLAT15929.1.p1 GENE.PLAT15929.1~~PLAT15929.1.p1  ORF type:complete len:572 (+),score=269.22 PLAT15929.1:1758-3473(+)
MPAAAAAAPFLSISLSVNMRRSLVLLLAAAAAAVAARPRVGADGYVSAHCEGATPTCTLAEGKDTAATAWARFDDTINSTGWSQLYVHSNGTYSDDLQAFGAGYLEGALTAQRIWQHWTNLAAHFFPQTGAPAANVSSWVTSNMKWTAEQVAASRSGAATGDGAAGSTSDTRYWSAIAWTNAQLSGLTAGYNAHVASDEGKLTEEQVMLINMQGDLTTVQQIMAPGGAPDWAHMTQQQRELWAETHSHCSAIVAVADDMSELWVAHTMWWSYYSMLRVFKYYAFAPSWSPAATSVQFSSFPATLSSTDDFYQMQPSRLAVWETTNGFYNTSLNAAVTPHAVLSWQRAMAANALADSGQLWSATFGLHNSGTYNNQWAAVDYKLFTPGQPLPAGLLWISEQLPGHYHAEDMTRTLALGHWASFNRPFFQSTYTLSGFAAMEASHGVYYSWDMYPRSQLFRRNATRVESTADLQAFMRYNNFETDPLSGGNPWNAIAARGDLVKQGGANRRADGSIDAKITSMKMMDAGQVLVQSGPTHDQQPVFEWSNGDWNCSHVGQPNRWDFGWVTMKTD